MVVELTPFRRRPSIAPCFKKMRLEASANRIRSVFVLVRSEMNPQWHTLQMFGELQVDWSIEYGIAAQNQECLDSYLPTFDP